MTRRAYVPQPGTIPHKVIAWLAGQSAGETFASAVIADALNVLPAAFSTSMKPALAAGLVKSSRRPGQLSLYWQLGDGKPAEPEAGEPDDDNDPPLIPRQRPRHPVASSVFDLARSSGAASAAAPICDHGATDHDRCAQCAAEISAGADGEVLVGGAAPAVVDAHEHFARTTIDQAKPLSVRDYVRAIDRVAPPDQPPPAPPPPLPRVRAGTAPYRFGIFNDGEFVQEKGGQRIVIDRDELERLIAFIERMHGEEAA